MKKTFQVHSKTVDIVEADVQLKDGRTIAGKVPCLTMELIDQEPEEHSRSITWVDVAPKDADLEAFEVGDLVVVTVAKKKD